MFHFCGNRTCNLGLHNNDLIKTPISSERRSKCKVRNKLHISNVFITKI